MEALGNWKISASFICIVLSVVLLFTGWLTFKDDSQKKAFVNGIENAKDLYEGIGSLLGGSGNKKSQADDYADKIYSILKDGALSPPEIIEIGTALGNAGPQVKEMFGLQSSNNSTEAAIEGLVEQNQLFALFFVLSLIMSGIYLYLHVQNKENIGYPMAISFILLAMMFFGVGTSINNLTRKVAENMLAMQVTPFLALCFSIASCALWNSGYREMRAAAAGRMAEEEAGRSIVYFDVRSGLKPEDSAPKKAAPVTVYTAVRPGEPASSEKTQSPGRTVFASGKTDEGPEEPDRKRLSERSAKEGQDPETEEDPEEKKERCPNCGELTSSLGRFCHFCGASLEKPGQYSIKTGCTDCPGRDAGRFRFCRDCQGGLNQNPAPEPVAVPEAAPAPESAAVPETAPISEPKLVSAAESAPEPESVPEPEHASEFDFAPEWDTDSAPEPEPVPESGPASEPEYAFDSAPEAESASEPEFVPEPVPASVPETKPAAEPNPKPEANPESESNPEPEAEPDTETIKEEDQPLYCAWCGATLIANARFCTKCGKPV